MNILYLTNELRYTCGVTNHLLHLAGGLAKDTSNNIYLFCGGGSGVERFRDTNVHVHIDRVFHHGERNYPNYLRAVWRLAGLIRKKKIDIVHSHTHYSANIAFHASRLTGKKTVQTGHGLLKHRGRLKHFKADLYVAINEHLYEHIIENVTGDKDRVHFIRCGIPVPQEPAEKDLAKFTVLAASRFTHEKGLDLYIKAVSLLPGHEREKIDFMIAGEGELEDELLKLNKELGTGIIFLGRVSDMGKLLSGTHIFVFPSRSGSEGFPAAITEAAAYNNLIVTSDFPGHRPLIDHETDGLVFRSENDYELMITIKLAVDGYRIYRTAAENFYNKVKKLFDLNTMLEKHTEMYERCIRM